MELRPYSGTDRGACLAVFDSHAPDDLAVDDRARFEEFLDTLPDPFLDDPASAYFVMEHEDGIVGCGGYSASGLEQGKGRATLTWGMVHRDFLRLGLGRFLLLYRLREIGKMPHIHMVVAAIPRSAERFFASQGFRATAAEHGSDRVFMLKKLTVCTS